METSYTSRGWRKTLAPANLLLCAGVIVTLLVTFLGGTRAVADLDVGVRVHDGSRFDESGTLFKSTEFTPVTRDYTMKRPNVSARTWSVEGVPLIEFLKKKYEADPSKLASTNFVKLRLKSDSTDFKIIPKSLLENDPPVVLTSKVTDAAGKSPVDSPAIVFPAAGEYAKNNREESIEIEDYELDLTASAGEKLSVGIKAEKMKDGNYRFSPAKKPKGHGTVTYKWILTDGKKQVGEHTGSIFKSTGIADSTSEFTAYLFVTTTDDSASTATKSVTGSKKDDQKTTPPPSSNTNSGSTNSTGTGTGTGTGTSGATSSTGSGTGSSTYKPPKYTPPKPSTLPVTPSTGSASGDTSGLSQLVAGMRGTGTARAVSGVMLSTPATTSNPAAGGSEGQSLQRLAQPLANAANDVFKPIEYPDNGWMLMVAVMFAAFVLGGVKEFRNP